MTDTADTAASKLEELRAAVLPVTNLAEVFAHLRRPFAPAAIKWKVQTVIWEEIAGSSDRRQGAILVAYIDARLVIERLNLVWPWWRERKDILGAEATRCSIELFTPLEGAAFTVSRTDVGTGADLKTRESDALKRAAVHYGIGVSIYALAQVKRLVGEGDSELRTEVRRVFNKREKKYENKIVPFIDGRTEAWLTDRYGIWLESKGEPLFGPTLDHGDEAGASGLEADSPAAAAELAGGEAVEPSEPAAEREVYKPLDDDRAVELRTQAEGLYQQVRAAAPRKLTPANFNLKLLKAGSTSHEALEKFVTELEAMRDEVAKDA